MLGLETHYEKELLAQGYKIVVGIDEAGRGCWAGPVAVGYYGYALDQTVCAGVGDSKKIPAPKRKTLQTKLAAIAKSYAGVLFAEPEVIDDLGIGKAIEDLISEVVEQFAEMSAYFLIDGYFPRVFNEHSEQLYRGDDSYYTIAAASILAKVQRDELMVAAEQEFPDYGFAQHKGYGTKQHKLALGKYGVTPLHRKSYKPVKALL